MAALIGASIRSAQESIRVVEFPLDYPKAGAGLPEGADIPLMREMEHTRAMALLRAPMECYLRRQTPYPTCVVSDFCLPWTSELAANLGVPRLCFFSMSAFFLLCQHNLKRFNAFDGVDRDSVNKPVAVPGLPGRRVEVTMAQAPGFFRGIPVPGWQEFADDIERSLAEAEGIIVNTFLGLEPEYVAGYAAARRMKVWTVGPVSLYHQQGTQTQESRGGNASAHDCLRWLDSNNHPNNSVVYVSFGSMLQADPKQAVELGLGLEASGHPFIWALRNWDEYDETVRAFLRDLQTRLAGRGLLISGWAPQVMILSHEAVGGVLTHCGWNSTLEAITAGLPMVTWPQCTDAFLNEKLVVEVLGVGVSIGVKEPSDFQMVKKDVLVGRDVVEKAVRCLMATGEEADERRRRAAALAAKARAAVLDGGSSHANLLDLVKRFQKEA